MLVRSEADQRRHDLDWLRVFAVLLLFPFHDARIFDVFDPFYVKNAQKSLVLSWVVVRFLNPWHMPLLFTLAGAASWFALGHRSAGAYARERVKRLLVPFVFGLIVIVPPQAYLAGLSRGAHLSYASFYSDYWRIRGDLNGYTGLWTPAHLWFISYLFVFSLLALPLFAALRRRLRQHPGPRRWPMWMLVLGFPVLMEITAGLLEDGLPNPLYYFVLFVAGFVLVADEQVQRAIDRWWRWMLGTAVVTMIVVLRVWYTGVDSTWADGSAISTGFGLLEAANTWLWVLALLGAASAFLRFENRLLRYANEAAYPVYLLHQTVIVAVGYFVVRWGLGPVPKWGVILVLSFGITVALYAFAVRRTNPMRVLFGLKPRRSTSLPPAPVAREKVGTAS